MTTLQKVMDDQRAFAIERNWVQFHSPKNLAMALGGELGELASALVDVFASSGVGAELAAVEAVTSEIADVTLYLLRMFDVLGFDLPEIYVEEKGRGTVPERDQAILLALAGLVGSVGRVLEAWQWADTGDKAVPDAVEVRLSVAFQDLVALAGIAGVKLANLASAKLAKNAIRYPVSKSFGSSAKYSELQ